MAPFPARQRLAASVCLLHSLTEVPALPTRGIEPRNNSNVKRTLSAARERQLSKDFAFLAAHSNDARTVKAVALEEGCENEGLTIRVAANTGSLQKAKDGLQKIGELLARAAEGRTLAIMQLRSCDNEQNRAAEKELLEHKIRECEARLAYQVVVLHWTRIFSRLKSIQFPSRRKRSNKARADAIKRLNALTSNSSFPTSSPTNKTAQQEAIDLGRELATQFLESNRSLNVDNSVNVQKVIQLVSSFDQMKKPLSLDDKKQDREIRVQLDQIRKLGHYKGVSRSLIAAATKYPRLFKRVLVEAVSSQDIDDDYPEGGLLPFNTICNQKRYPNFLPAHLTELQKRYERGSTRWKATTGFKVHAEVQLLLYYETNPPVIWPRYLSSNKRACYLCHLLISRHGGFHVPNSHGRLYPQWALPDLPPRLQKKFERVMQNTISEIENDVDSCTQRRPKHPVPIESQFSLPLTASEVSSVKLEPRVLEETRFELQQAQIQVERVLDIGDQTALELTTEPRIMETNYEQDSTIINDITPETDSVASTDKSHSVPTEEFSTPLVNNEHAQAYEAPITHEEVRNKDHVEPQLEKPYMPIESIPPTDISESSNVPLELQEDIGMERFSSSIAGKNGCYATYSFDTRASETWSYYHVSPESPCIVKVGEDYIHVHLDSLPLEFEPGEQFWIGFQKLSHERTDQWRSHGIGSVDIRQIGREPGEVAAQSGGVQSNSPLLLRSGLEFYIFQYAHGTIPPGEPLPSA